MKTIKTAITAFGLSGKVFHAPFLQASPDFELSHILQRSSDESNQLYPDAKIVRSYPEILDNKEIELIVVNTPNTLHFSMAKAALEAGKHVIVEKPFAGSLNETNVLIELAARKNLHLFIFHNRRWDGDFMTVKKIIESDVLGDLVEYEAHYDRYKPVLNPKPWKETPDIGSGILYDLGTHIIDQAVCLFGMPKYVTADIRIQRINSRVDDYFQLMLEYDHLKVTLKSTLLAKEESPRYIIYGQKGSFVKYGVDPQEDDMIAGMPLSSNNWGKEKEKYWGILNASINGVNFRGKMETLAGDYRLFYKNVIDVIRNNAQISLPPNEAQITTRIIEAAIKSHQDKQTVKILLNV